MRSRRRRLARQRKKWGGLGVVYYSKPGKYVKDSVFRVWGKPIGCFDNVSKLRKEER